MLKTESKEFTSCIGTIAILGLALIAGTAMNGWGLSMLWGWFIVPIFKAPPLSTVQAIGVAMVISFLTSDLQSETYKSKDFADLIGIFAGKAIVYPVIVVAIGWLVSGLL